MTLQELLQDVDVLDSHADPNMQISGITADSRMVRRGDMFVAISGFSSNGNRYIPMALEKGAAVVVTAQTPQEDIPYILVRSDRRALAQCAAALYGHPSRAMTMIGITGTNGKTTVTWLVKQILERVAGARVGLIGTMENHIADVVEEASRTTPEGDELQRLFARMRDAGCTHCVMEVSSHAIALERVAGVHFQVAAFTNLTEDHLDFHGTMENYCQAKTQLFRNCDKAVLNADDAWFDRFAQAADCPALCCSAAKTTDLYAKDIRLLPDGVTFTAVCGGDAVQVQVPIPGKFTVYNTMTALGVAMQLGIGLHESAAALADVQGVKGRVEVVPTPGRDFTVLIDYAHTPDGLENVLSSVREVCKGRLIVVFGCGGDRDPVKRPIMGRIGVELSDLAIITSDNPRTESPMSIIEQICAGAEKAAGRYTVIENRRNAITYAMDIAEKDDIIVLAGKGHETYQEIMGVKHHLDEREVVAAHLAEMR